MKGADYLVIVVPLRSFMIPALFNGFIACIFIQGFAYSVSGLQTNHLFEY
ncbi:NAD(P)H-dependent oxidoreductase [Fluoribacter gormanii]